MTNDPITLRLPAEAISDLCNAALGQLHPVTQGEEQPQAFTLRDSFDYAVAGKHLGLIEIGGCFELLMRDGSVLSQSARRTGDFVTDLPEGPVRLALSHLSPLRSLLPLAMGQVQRSALAFVDDEGKTQARLLLTVLAPEQGDVIALATLSGLRGYGRALERLGARVTALGGEPLGPAQLYTALAPQAVPFVSRPDVPIDPKDTAFETATAIIHAHLPLVRVNEPGLLDDVDTEFLHHYRIGLRKIRSVLGLFKGVYGAEQTEDLKARFSALMAATGRLRDLDVYLLDRQVFYDFVPGTVHGGLDRMFEIFAAERVRELTRLRRHLRSTAYAEEMEQLEKLFRKRRALQRGPKAKTRVDRSAAKLIWKRYHKICTIAEAITPETPDEEVHHLRIQCKKLRYLLEFFLPLYGNDVLKPLIKSLKRLQETLGDFNDYAVQQESLQAFLQDLGTDIPEALEIAQAVGALVAVLHSRQLEARACVTDRFIQFNSAETAAQFETLFHGGKALSC